MVGGPQWAGVYHLQAFYCNTVLYCIYTVVLSDPTSNACMPEKVLAAARFELAPPKRLVP